MPSLNVGQISLTRVVDSSVRLDPAKIYDRMSPVDWSRHGLLDDDGFLPLTFGGYVIRTANRVVLVDAGVGPHDVAGQNATMPGGSMLENLRASGITPDEITDVVFTHLHVDHVGWGAVGDRIIFPNATYRCHRADWDYFTNGGAMGAPQKLAVMARVMKFWSSDTTLAPGLDIVTTPGHTPGSSIIVLSDGDARGVLLGDVVHCPAELAEDEWQTIGDVDPEMARRTATALAREYEGADIAIGAAHFDDLRFGRLLVGERRRKWVYA